MAPVFRRSCSSSLITAENCCMLIIKLILTIYIFMYERFWQLSERVKSRRYCRVFTSGSVNVSLYAHKIFITIWISFQILYHIRSPRQARVVINCRFWTISVSGHKSGSLFLLPRKTAEDKNLARSPYM